MNSNCRNSIENTPNQQSSATEDNRVAGDNLLDIEGLREIAKIISNMKQQVRLPDININEVAEGERQTDKVVGDND
jgi:hypothetical protein